MWRLVLLLITIFLLGACVSQPKVGVTLTAGAAGTKITPSKDPAKIHDDTYARALVLADGRIRLAIVTADLGGLGVEHCRGIQQAINQATGIPAEHIIINCSHTHGAPWPPGDTVWEDGLTYSQWLTRCFVDVVKRADEARRPAIIKYGRRATQIGFNRRSMYADGYMRMAVNPHGPVAPWVDVLGAYGQADDKRIGVLISHAAHPVSVHESSDLITGDYPGEALKQLREWLTEGVFMFAQGCCGNINVFPVAGGFQPCKITGWTVAHAALHSDFHAINPGPLKVASLELSLPYQSPPSVTECEKLIKERPDDKRLPWLLSLAKEKQPRFLPFPMRAMAVGDELCILALPYEMFVEYQLFAEKISPFKHTLVFGYTNGTGAYVAMRKDYELGDRGGYEPTRPLHPSVEKMIKQGLRQLLGELK